MEAGVREVLALEDSPAARELLDMLEATIDAHGPAGNSHDQPAPVTADRRA